MRKLSESEFVTSVQVLLMLMGAIIEAHPRILPFAWSTNIRWSSKGGIQAKEGEEDLKECIKRNKAVARFSYTIGIMPTSAQVSRI